MRLLGYVRFECVSITTLNVCDRLPGIQNGLPLRPFMLPLVRQVLLPLLNTHVDHCFLDRAPSTHIASDRSRIPRLSFRIGLGCRKCPFRSRNIHAIYCQKLGGHCEKFNVTGFVSV